MIGDNLTCGQPLQRGQGLSSIALLDTDVDVVLLGPYVLIVS